MRSWQRGFTGQGTLLLTQELGSGGELQSAVMEHRDTMTHALQGECGTYRGCQSSGVTDSDSERQHEINMAVQTVQGRGHTDSQEGGTETHVLARTRIRTSSSRTRHQRAVLGCTPPRRTSPRQSQPFSARTQNPAVHRGVWKGIHVLTHLQAIAHAPTNPLTHPSQRSHPRNQQGTYASAQAAWLASHWRFLSAAHMKCYSWNKQLRKEGDNTQS